jgi:hypothetical protein
VSDSKEDADKAAKDRQDAARIRSGEDPEVVKSERAQSDAADAKAKVDRDIADAQRRKDAAEADAKAKFFEAERANPDPRIDDKTRDAANKAAEKAREALDKAARDLQTEQASGAEKKRGIDERAAGTVESLDDQRSKRLERERQQREREEEQRRIEQERERQQREREEEQRRIEQERRARDSARDDLNNAETGLDETGREVGRKFRNAGRNLKGRGRSGAASALQGIGAELEDGTNAAEISALKDQFNEAVKGLGGNTVAAMRQMLDEMARQAAEIEAMKGQIKNSRTNR